MAMKDTRVFKDADGRVWVTQIHSQSGAAYAGEGESVPNHIPITRESALFTCLSDPTIKSRKIRLQVGELLRVGHEALLRLLEESTEIESRFKLGPYGIPDSNEYPVKFPECGLSWGYKKLRWVELFIGDGEEPKVKSKVAIEVACFDDSALKGKANIIFDPATMELSDDLILASAKAFARSLYYDPEQATGIVQKEVL